MPSPGLISKAVRPPKSATFSPTVRLPFVLIPPQMIPSNKVTSD